MLQVGAARQPLIGKPGIAYGGSKVRLKAALKMRRHCIEAAQRVFWHIDTFEHSALLATNLGDDAETTTAACGQVAGAIRWASQIPEEGLSVLHWCAGIEQLALSQFQGNTADNGPTEAPCTTEN